MILKNKVFALSAVMLLMAAAGIAMTPAVMGASPESHFEYTTWESRPNEVVITKYTGPGGDVVIPSTIGGKPVTVISSKAFMDCTSVTSVIVPDSVEELWAQVFFGCTALRSVTIPDEISMFSHGMFIRCSSLTTVNLGSGVTEIGLRTFEDCTSLRYVAIPASVTFINWDAFEGTTDVTVQFEGNAPTVHADWAKDANGLTVLYRTGAMGFTTPTWNGVPCQSAPYTITFNSDGGSSVSSRQVASGSPYGTLPTPTKAGYTFDGWYDGATKVTSATVPSSDTTLKAKWLANNIQYAAPPSGNLAAGIYWSHQLSTTPGVSITVSGAGTSWIQVNGGTVSGVPPSAGVYEVSVLLTAPNHISQSKSFSVNVLPQLVLTNSPAAGAIAYVVL